MNYKPLTIEKLQELIAKYPDYTLGELFYSVLRYPIFKDRRDGASIGWLLEVDDKELYTAIDRAITEEQE